MNADSDIARHAPARSRSRWLRRLIPAGLVVIALVLVGLVAQMPQNATPPAPHEVVPVNVTVQLVQAVPLLADTFELTAVVEPNRVVKVAAEVAGRIERWAERSADATWHGGVLRKGATLAEGEPISAGDPIMYLNKDLLQARLERAVAQFEYDQRECGRILGLFEAGGSTSKTELDDARTKRDISKALREEAARELERTTIVAPIGGILNRLPMELGEYASPGDKVAEIVDIETAKIVVDVPERDVSFLQVGQAATIIFPGHENVSSGDITYIDAMAHEGTRTTRVEISVDNNDGRLRSGQIVHARLARRVLTDVIMIPLASVIPLEDGKEVYVVSDGRAERREVELGFIKGREVRIVSGLKAGDQLIVSGHRYVGPGQPVNVVEEVQE